jgi:hypothetical protein
MVKNFLTFLEQKIMLTVNDPQNLLPQPLLGYKDMDDKILEIPSHGIPLGTKNK